MAFGQDAGVAFHHISCHSSQKAPSLPLLSTHEQLLAPRKKSLTPIINNDHNNPAMLHGL